MTKISAVIITFNEEKNIGRCLDSLKEVADDIVVLDSYSTDKTQAICKEKGARFFQHIFDGHIEQKNRVITYAKYPHCLSLDADEALDETLRKSILEVKSDWKPDGYSMNRLTNYCGTWIKHCGWYPDVKLRLWDSRKGKWGGVNPHDKYEMNKGVSVRHIKGDILHYSYYTPDDHYKQVEYFTDIAAKAGFKNGVSANALQMYFSPVAKFIRDYFIKAGFLDGKAGYAISRISAYATFLKYKKLREIHRNAGSM